MERIPDGFKATNDSIDSQVKCTNCGVVCTVGVEYGEQATDHECYQSTPQYEDSGFPVNI